MSVEINPPFRVFTDVDGEPLEDGFIYIGAANQNPEAVPVSVFWDTALTIPAAQPIRTLGGYPSRAGTPSRMYVAQDQYSIAVRNKNSTLVYTDLNNTAGDASLRQELASPTGTEEIGRGSGTLEDSLEAIDTAIADFVTKTELSASGGAGLVGYNGETVEEALDRMTPLGTIGTYLTADMGHAAGVLTYAKEGTGRARLLTSLERYYPAGAFETPGLKAYYVDPAAGNDASAGTDWATALKRVPTAMAKADVDIVYCKAGLYSLDSSGQQSLANYTGIRDIALIAVGGEALFTTAREVTWSPNATYPNVAESSGTGGTIVKVVDLLTLNAQGNYTSLTNVASLDICSATPGSWFFSASVVYVNPITGRIADASTLAIRSSVMRISAPNVRIYQRGIHYIGGSGGAFSVRDAAGAIVTSENCKFSNNFNSDGYQIKDSLLSIAINCSAFDNFNDGFNYHELNAVNPDFIEIDCVGYGNLDTGSGNGSTSHEDVRGIRINGRYFTNRGPGIADVQTAKTFNICCTTTDNGPSTSAAGFLISHTVEAWVDGLVSYGNDGPGIDVKDTATLHHRDAWSDDGITAAPGATVNTVMPVMP